MKVAFQLSMPKHAQAVVDGGPYYHDFGDGWGASVSAKIVDDAEARRLTRKSAGFCGYDWMLDEIREHGRILTRAESQARRAGGAR